MHSVAFKANIKLNRFEFPNILQWKGICDTTRWMAGVFGIISIHHLPPMFAIIQGDKFF